MKKIASTILVTLLCASTYAGSLEQAELSKIINEVAVVDPAQGAHPAALRETIKGDLGVKTGSKSRAELLFQDNTLTRLGAETFFSFKPGTRDMKLDRGTMLLQVPKNLGGAKIHTAAVTASITGTTIMIEYTPGNHIKVLVLEGSLRLSLDKKLGSAMLLTAGKMVMMRPDAKSIPEPVDVDLKKLTQTSNLVNPERFKGDGKIAVAPLPSIGLIEKEIAAQEGLKGKNRLVDTNLLIVGNSTNVTLASQETLANLDPRSNLTPPATEAGATTTSTVTSDESDKTTGRSGKPLGGGTGGTGGGTGGTGGGTGGTGGGTGGTGGGTGGTGGGTGGTGGGTGGTGGGTGGTGGGTGGTGGSTGGTGGSTGGTGGSTGGTGGSTGGTGGSTGGTGGSTGGTGGSTGGTGGSTGGTIVVTDAPLATPILVPPVNNNPTPTVVPATIVTAGPYIIKANTVIDTTKTNPTITTDGVTNNSLFFTNIKSSGSPSKFLFGSSSLFDGQMNFDTQFNQQFANSGVYKFNTLEIEGNPTFLTREGANSIALISVGDITSSTLPGQVNLSGLRELFLGTANGSISITDKLAFNKVDGTAFNFLQLYARNGSVDFGAPVTLHDGKLYISAQNDVVIDPTANIQTTIASFTGLGNVSVDGVLNSAFVQLYAGSTLTTKGAITGNHFFGFGTNANLGGSINVQDGTFQIGSNLTVAPGAAINANTLTLTTGGIFDVEGTLGATEGMTVKAGDLIVNGVVNTPGNFQATAQTVTVGGTVKGANTNATYTVAKTFNETAGGLIKGNNLTITTGGALTLGAVTENNTVLLTSGGDPLQVGDMIFNAPVTAQQVQASGPNVTVNNTITGQKLTFTTTGDFVSNVGGDLTASNGDSALTITSGGSIDLNGKVTANNATLTGWTNNKLLGNVDLNGAVQVQNNFSATGDAITLNAALSGKDATFTAGSNFVLASLGSINNTGNTTITAPTLIELDGNTTVNNLTFGGSAGVLINGLVNGQTISSASKSTLQDVRLNGPVTLAKDLTITNSGNFVVGAGSSLSTGGQTNVTAGKNITFNGAATANTFNLTANNGTFTANAAVTSPNAFSVTSKNATVNSSLSANSVNFTVNQDLSLADGASMTTVKDVTINSGRDVTLAGTTSANNVNLAAHGQTTISGNVTAAGSVQIDGGANPGNDAVISAQIKAASISIQPKNNLNLTSGGTLLSTGNVNLLGQKITVDGQVTGNAVTLGDNKTNTFSVGGQIQSQSFTATGQTGIFNGSVSSAKDLKVTLTSGFSEGTGASMVAPGNLTVTAAGVTIDGGMNADNVSATSTGNLDVTSGANLQGAASVSLSGVNTLINGIVNAPTVNIVGSNSLALNVTNGFISADNATLNSGGLLTLSGASGGSGGIDLARLASLVASGKGIIVQNDFVLPGGNSSLTAGSSGIDATGADLAGFRTITINNGSYGGRSLSVDTLNINQNGNLTLTGNLNSTNKVTVPGSVNVAGNITANNLTAGKDITAQTLSVGNLNTPILTVGSGGITSYAGGTKIVAPTIKSAMGVFMTGNSGTPTATPGNGGSFDLTTAGVIVDAAGTQPGTLTSANFDGGDADPTRSDAGGNGGTFKLTSSGDFTVNSPLSATTGQNSQAGMTGGNGGTVDVTTTGAITVNSGVKVSSTETSSNPGDNTPGRASAKGGTIKLNSKKTNGVAIAVNNSGELLALLNAAGNGTGGMIQFTSAGGAINVNGGRIQADKGTIDIRNNGAAGAVNLTNANLSADVVKVGALGTSGQLVIGGGSISANSAIKLYGGSSNGTVLFNGNVALNGASVKTIAANTVTIANGYTVTVNGTKANVYTNKANYAGSGGNGSTSGKFAGSGATTSALLLAPGF